MRLRIPELEHGAEIHRTRNLGAGFLAHQIGKTPGQFALIRLRKCAVQHVGYDETKNVAPPEIAAADSWNRGCRPTAPECVTSTHVQAFPCRQIRSRSCLRARSGPSPCGSSTIVNSSAPAHRHGRRRELPRRVRPRRWEEMIPWKPRLPTMFSNGTMPTWLNRLSVELSRLSPIMK